RLSEDFERAAEFHRQALSVFRRARYPRGEASALGNLGNLYHELGDCRRAVDYYEQELVVARAAEQLTNIGRVLINLGAAHWQLGERVAALARVEEACATLERSGDSEVETARRLLAEWRDAPEPDA
ncbi:MAG TPA: tetratricopeptide repeat protein, partial [Pyrinomonadaceae bacterium]